MYIFRLDSLAQVKDSIVTLRPGKDGKYGPAVESNQYMGRVAGRITIVRVLRGKPVSRYIEFDTSDCGGLRLDVGHYFFIASSGGDLVLRPGPADHSIIDLHGQFYEGGSATSNDRQPFMRTILKYLKGEPLPRDFPSDAMIQYTQAEPMPPPRRGELR